MVCLDLLPLNLTERVNFDVNILAKEHETHVVEFVDCVGEMQDERRNNEKDEMSGDDSEDADFNEAEQVSVDEYDDTSLNEESFISDEGLDDTELEFDTKSRICFGR